MLFSASSNQHRDFANWYKNSQMTRQIIVKGMSELKLENTADESVVYPALEAIVTWFSSLRHARTLLKASSKPTMNHVLPILERVNWGCFQPALPSVPHEICHINWLSWWQGKRYIKWRKSNIMMWGVLPFSCVLAWTLFISSLRRYHPRVEHWLNRSSEKWLLLAMHHHHHHLWLLDFLQNFSWSKLQKGLHWILKAGICHKNVLLDCVKAVVRRTV